MPVCAICEGDLAEYQVHELLTTFDRGQVRLPQIGRAGQQGQHAVRPQIQALEHAVATGVVAGQPVHAFLTEEQQAVEAGLSHLLAHPPPARGKLVAGEVQRQRSVYRLFANSGSGLS